MLGRERHLLLYNHECGEEVGVPAGRLATLVFLFTPLLVTFHHDALNDVDVSGGPKTC